MVAVVELQGLDQALYRVLALLGLRRKIISLLGLINLSLVVAEEVGRSGLT
jgi:hypothetical protein